MKAYKFAGVFLTNIEEIEVLDILGDYVYGKKGLMF